VKPVLDEFSSGVSLCPNRGIHSEWRPHFCPGPAWPGGT